MAVVCGVLVLRIDAVIKGNGWDAADVDGLMRWSSRRKRELTCRRLQQGEYCYSGNCACHEWDIPGLKGHGFVV